MQRRQNLNSWLTPFTSHRGWRCVPLPLGALRIASAVALLLFLIASAACQTEPAKPATPPLPEAPQPQTPADKPAQGTPPCPALPASRPATAPSAATAKPAATIAVPATQTPLAPSAATQPATPPCTPSKPVNWFARFINGPEVKPLTAKEKARLAVRNLLDPFNAITILGQSGIAVASDSHSPYGPGMPGFARNVGVSYAEDMTGEAFGTFLIPAITHQDPHYHRMPNASIRRRALHAAAEIVWTQGDNGRGMLNYANLVGSAIEIGISNLYVPGEETDFSADAARYSIGLATAPIDNFVTEFLPDVARRIHVRIVIVQRIINQVATTEGGSTP